MIAKKDKFQKICRELWKKKLVRLSVLMLIGIILLLITWQFRIGFPEPIGDYSSNIVAIFALLVVVWDKVLRLPPEPKREYHVSPHGLKYDLRFNPFSLNVRIVNTGDVPINLIFSWVDFNNMRFEFYKLEDSRGKPIDSSITIKPHSSKEVIALFRTDDSRWSTIKNDLMDVFGKRKDIRILEPLVQKEARLVWSDATDKSQEKKFPLGVFFREAVSIKARQIIEERSR